MADISSANVTVRIVPGSTSVRVMMDALQYLRVHRNQVELRGGDTQEIDELIFDIEESIQQMPTESGADLIAVERGHQVFVRGYSPEHDDQWTVSELVKAAVCYAWEAVAPRNNSLEWPWGKSAWKPSTSPIRNLVKAGAFIAAEIDRLKRMEK